MHKAFSVLAGRYRGYGTLSSYRLKAAFDIHPQIAIYLILSNTFPKMFGLFQLVVWREYVNDADKV